MLGGACAALLVVWALGTHPGRTDEGLDELRSLVVAQHRLCSEHLQALDARVATLAAAPRGPMEDAGARAALHDLASDVELLRDSVRMELMVVDAELERLADVIDDVAGGLGGPDPAGPLTPEAEPRWVVLAGDPEPGVRFSALVRLGRSRTDRSVQASLSRLDDDAPQVVWQALRNLGAFRSREAAPRVARLLGHESPIVRSAAHETLLRLGAPDDTGYDPVADPGDRAAAAARLRAWAEE